MSPFLATASNFQQHRMNVADAEVFERNITSWFHQWDRRRSVTSSTPDLTKNTTTIETNQGGNRTGKKAGRTEMHTRLLLDCSSNQLTGKSATQVLAKKKNNLSAKLRTFRFRNFSLKSAKKPETNPAAHVWNLGTRLPFASLSPVLDTGEQSRSEASGRVASANQSMNSFLHSLKEDVYFNSPHKQRRFPKTNSLRRLVTLREHRKKCEKSLIKIG